MTAGTRAGAVLVTRHLRIVAVVIDVGVVGGPIHGNTFGAVLVLGLHAGLDPLAVDLLHERRRGRDRGRARDFPTVLLRTQLGHLFASAADRVAMRVVAFAANQVGQDPSSGVDEPIADLINQNANRIKREKSQELVVIDLTCKTVKLASLAKVTFSASLG